MASGAQQNSSPPCLFNLSSLEGASRRTSAEGHYSTEDFDFLWVQVTGIHSVAEPSEGRDGFGGEVLALEGLPCAVGGENKKSEEDRPWVENQIKNGGGEGG